MQLSISAHALRDFTRAITCLTKFGDDIDFGVSANLLKLSTVNSARSAFCKFDFEAAFFSHYAPGKTLATNFSINGKALLSPLKTRSVATIESVTMSLVDAAPEDEGDATEVGGNECRLVVRLNCKHGVIKTRRLTYTSSVSLYATASRDRCPSSWTVSSRILKEWIEHFSLKSGSGSNAGGTDEIGFIMSNDSCILTSNNHKDLEVDVALLHYNSRPTATEIRVEVGDFDAYVLEGEPAIQIALKEFKAIIHIADALSTSISAGFSTGGQPIIMDIKGDLFEADFVMATTVFYDENGNQIDAIPPKEESEQPQERDPIPAPRTSNGNAIAGPSGSRNVLAGVPRRALFSQSTPAPADEEEDEYGDSFVDLDEADFSAIDLLSQAATAKQKSIEVTPKKKQKLAETLVLDSEDAPEREVLVLEEDEDFTYGTNVGATADSMQEKQEEEGEEEEYAESQPGPNKKSKKEWNLFGN